MAGTNFLASISAATEVCLTNDAGLAILVTCTGAGETQANVYAPGCLLIRTDTTALYQNTGTAASPVWSINGTGASGASGVSGASTSGYSGASGASGNSGYSGASGISG